MAEGPKNFAVIGAGGYIAPRHLKAIQDTGNRLVAAVDPNDSVGILDRYSYDVRYFREIERFDRHLDRLRRGPEEGRIDWVAVCSPNYLNGANVLCEKPIVINPWNLDALEEVERETGRRVFTVLQLRTHPQLIALRDRLHAEPSARRRQVALTYVTSRGPWYHVSWKGTEEKSGGVATNVGIHLFDLLIWLFGKAVATRVTTNEPSRMAGEIELAGADVTWSHSVNAGDLPEEASRSNSPRASPSSTPRSTPAPPAARASASPTPAPRSSSSTPSGLGVRSLLCDIRPSSRHVTEWRPSADLAFDGLVPRL